MASQNQQRRTERAARAQEIVFKRIPELLRGIPKARHAIHSSERIDDPKPRSRRSLSGRDAVITSSRINIRVVCSDTLTAAKTLSRSSASSKSVDLRSTRHANVAVLNFASSLRPGGGFLDGANSQEEFLCTRTTLYPSLWDKFYRLPEVGGIFTPDVLVFKDSTPKADDLPASERYFIDMISAGMIRFPDMRKLSPEVEPDCTCGMSYCDEHRDLVAQKMEAVLRIAQTKGNKKVILGAWGCGAYGNPVQEVARLWRSVITGSQRQQQPDAQKWLGIEEIVFAIPDQSMVRHFEACFRDMLPQASYGSTKAGVERGEDVANDILAKIAEVEIQIDRASSARARARLHEVLTQLNHDLVASLSKSGVRDEDLTLQEDEESQDYTTSGFPSSESEHHNDFDFDEGDLPTDSSDGDFSDDYEQRPMIAGAKHDSSQQHAYEAEFKDAPRGDDVFGAVFGRRRRDQAEDNMNSLASNFDVATGWYNGSMEELTRMLNIQIQSEDSQAHRSHSKAQHDYNEQAIDAYLSRYGGSDGLSAISSVM